MKIQGWWFGPENNRLGYRDGREVAVGVEHEVEGDIIPCERGLHLSPRMIDALRYSKGPVIWRVEGSGTVAAHGRPVDQYACSHRRYIGGGVDVSETLRRFACMCALDVIHLWDAPDIVVRYLKTGDASIRRLAAMAVDSLPGDLAWAASWAIAPEWDDAWATAAWASSRSATGDEARTKQNRRLTAMVSAAMRKGNP